MTPLTKQVSRRGTVPYMGRTLAITLYPNDLIGVRQSGTRKEFVTTIAAIYCLSVRQELAHRKAEKAKAKKARGKK